MLILSSNVLDQEALKALYVKYNDSITEVEFDILDAVKLKGIVGNSEPPIPHYKTQRILIQLVVDAACNGGGPFDPCSLITTDKAKLTQSDREQFASAIATQIKGKVKTTFTKGAVIRLTLPLRNYAEFLRTLRVMYAYNSIEYDYDYEALNKALPN